MFGAVAARASVVLGAAATAQPAADAPPPTPLEQLARRTTSTMSNPYRLVERWPTLPDGMTWGAAIGIIPDNKGGAWMMFRSEPPINYIDASGTITKSFGRGLLVQGHGFCMDHDGNLWVGDSGPFAEDPATKGRGFQLHKLTQDGKLLFSLGKAGVSRAGTRHVHRPDGVRRRGERRHPRRRRALAAPRERAAGRRSHRAAETGRHVRARRRQPRRGPGQFMGPHALAFDSRGRLFVADRSNNRVQVLDENLEFVDEWRHFGRPSGVAISKDDTLIVADSESTNFIDGPPAGARGRRASAAQSRLANRHSHRQRGGRLAAAFRAGHAARRVGRRRARQHLRGAHGALRREPVRRLSAKMGEGATMKLERIVRPRAFAAAASLVAAVAIPALCSGQAPPPAVDVLKADIDAVVAAPDGGADRQIKVVDVGKLNVGVGVLTQGARRRPPASPSPASRTRRSPRSTTFCRGPAC